MALMAGHADPLSFLEPPTMDDWRIQTAVVRLALKRRAEQQSQFAKVVGQACAAELAKVMKKMFGG